MNKTTTQTNSSPSKFHLLWLVALVAVGVAFLYFWGLNPRPISKINLSVFETPQVLADSLILRLREELIRSPVLVIAFDPQQTYHLEVVKAFLAAPMDGSMSYPYIFVQKEYSELFPLSQSVDFKEEVSTAVAALSDKIKSGQRMIFLVPILYGSQFISLSPAQRIADELRKSNSTVPTLMSFVFVNFPRSREDEKNSQLPCRVEVVDLEGPGPLGCLILQNARAVYRKKMTSGKTVGRVDQIAISEYLVQTSVEP